MNDDEKLTPHTTIMKDRRCTNHRKAIRKKNLKLASELRDNLKKRKRQKKLRTLVQKGLVNNHLVKE